MPLAEAADTLLAKPVEALQYALEGLLLLEFGFGEELVGIADDLFLKGFGGIVLQGQGQVLALNGIGGKACACACGMFPRFARNTRIQRIRLRYPLPLRNVPPEDQGRFPG